MCGRYALLALNQQVAAMFGVRVLPPVVREAAPRFNIAPGQPIAIVRAAGEGEREFAAVMWGFVPRWQKDPGGARAPINARSETVATSPYFRDAFARRRCLVPADAFYEWQQVEGGKRPMAVRRRDRGIIAMAGLWEPGADGGENPQTGVILTCPPNEALSNVHDRMPVILEPGQWDAWLTPDADRAELAGMLRPCPDRDLEVYPVSRRVNNPRADDPRLLDPAGSEPRATRVDGGLFDEG